MKMSPTTQLYLAVVMCLTGLGLLIMGFIVPPRGEIHYSVLVGAGEVMTFAGSLLGLDYKYRSHGNE